MMKNTAGCDPDTPSEPEEAANTLVVKRKYTRKAETEGV